MGEGVLSLGAVVLSRFFQLASMLCDTHMKAPIFCFWLFRFEFVNSGRSSKAWCILIYHPSGCVLLLT